MTIRARAGGAWRSITSASVFAGGDWRALRAARVYSDGAWRAVDGFTVPMASVINPNRAFGSASAETTTQVTTEPATMFVTGGRAPYTYAWAIISSTKTIGLLGSTLATASFFAEVAPFEVVQASARCVATDSLGSTTSAECAVELITFSFQ